MKAKQYVKITKIGVADCPIAPTPEMSKYVPGQNNGPVSLPLTYQAEGFLLENVRLNQSILIERYNRNGVKSHGFFNTSPIRKITEINGAFYIDTDNSRYLLVVLNQ